MEEKKKKVAWEMKAIQEQNLALIYLEQLL